MTDQHQQPQDEQISGATDSPPTSQISLTDALNKAKVVWRRLGPAGPLAIIAASLPALGGFFILGSMKWSGNWLRSQEEFGICLYILAFSVLAGLALLPTYAQAMLGGYAFRFGTGTAAALGGILGAATIAYAIARRASGNRVVQLIEEQPKWKAVYDSLLRSNFGKTLLIVTLLRIPPNSPFAITNLVLAATRVRPLIYLLGTILGIAPRTAIAAFIGAGLSELDFSKPRNTWMFVGGIVITIIVVGIIGLLANRAIERVTAQNRNEKK